MKDSSSIGKMYVDFTEAVRLMGEVHNADSQEKEKKQAKIESLAVDIVLQLTGKRITSLEGQEVYSKDIMSEDTIKNIADAELARTSYTDKELLRNKIVGRVMRFSNGYCNPNYVIRIVQDYLDERKVEHV